MTLAYLKLTAESNIIFSKQTKYANLTKKDKLYPIMKISNVLEMMLIPYIVIPIIDITIDSYDIENIE